VAVFLLPRSRKKGSKERLRLSFLLFFVFPPSLLLLLVCPAGGCVAMAENTNEAERQMRACVDLTKTVGA